MKRTTLASLLVAAVLGQVGAGQDADRRADQRRASTVMIRLPKIGVEQAAGRARRRRHLGEDRERQAAEALRTSRTPRIQTSQPRPKAVAASDRVIGDRRCARRRPA